IAAQRRNQRGTAGRLYTMPKPVVAAIPGPAAGAGLSLALACDLRIASESARFTTAFAKVGFSGDYGSSYFLPQIVGAAKAKELFFTADVIEADEALRLGIVNRVVPDDELESETRAFADQLAQGPTIAYRYMKKNLNAAIAGAPIGDVFDLEAWNMTRTGQTEDHKEAARAFVEKRKPTFHGR
ncbi:MAG: enoyl-CoA hydratase-related protein, partial [Thermoanaerobaculia bacterium]|nr:enoyl-CoA hydratase-related protein [Thermoanaerobaculia bacterium]